MKFFIAKECVPEHIRALTTPFPQASFNFRPQRRSSPLSPSSSSATLQLTNVVDTTTEWLASNLSNHANQRDAARFYFHHSYQAQNGPSCQPQGKSGKGEVISLHLELMDLWTAAACWSFDRSLVEGLSGGESWRSAGRSELKSKLENVLVRHANTFLAKNVGQFNLEKFISTAFYIPKQRRTWSSEPSPQPGMGQRVTGLSAIILNKS